MRKQLADRFLSFFSGISLESYGLEASLSESLGGDSTRLRLAASFSALSASLYSLDSTGLPARRFISRPSRCNY